MTTDLIIIVPTRTRPQNVGPVVQAWRDTGAFEQGAELHFVIDGDDPAHDGYVAVLDEVRDEFAYAVRAVTYAVHATWRPLVPKLNAAALDLLLWSPGALGFAGDDHLPRTYGWARRYVDELRGGAGIVHGHDGYRSDDLPTEWAMRAGIVGALGRMVPAPVEHLYCDDSIRDLGKATGIIRQLPDVSIEHMTPYAGKIPFDEQYQRVNSRQQYRTDRHAYREWRDCGGLTVDVALIEKLREGETQ